MTARPAAAGIEAPAITNAPSAASLRPLPPTRFLMLAALGALAIPTLVSVGRRYWSTAEGAQGPIVLATAAWLLWRSRVALARGAAPLARSAWALLVIPLALTYAFARAYGSLPIETTALYGIGVLVALLYLGPGAVRQFWFPFVYPVFLIVPPPSLVVALTQPLRIWISSVSVDFLHLLGYPVALSGATIQIAQYELLVRTACAGLGSMFTLCAVGLLYVHLRRDPRPGYALALLLSVVPVAILANLARVVILILATWYVGSEFAQGAAHELTGLLTLCLAMGGMFAVDAGLTALGGRNENHNG